MVALRIGDREIPCDFADESFDGFFMAKYHDERRLPEIAQDWDRIPKVTVIDPLREREVSGYTKLAGISITAGGSVLIRLGKEDTDE